MKELNEAVKSFIKQHGDSSVVTIDDRLIFRRLRELDEMDDRMFKEIMNELTFDFCSVENGYEVWN
ncbi:MULTISPECIES: hypothetical protein [unclassified Lactococcus]|uniref:hypothetical protein n=1 Tax=unclassified Lactococcus TaxID=2643510 RepID=UPI0011CB88DB|nr:MULTISPECIES: hypothetical protein [unclassified Lactococcus]MQW21981.1 hypothetical protein [Lactococcus sp. dk101]TXK36838.1 hypothetical protein FVP42_10705 [Lactococcus sp. dk310]TXK47464.1 hypothetical protein FVP43_10135 [Lactococcus sp. dk322]